MVHWMLDTLVADHGTALGGPAPEGYVYELWRRAPGAAPKAKEVQRANMVTQATGGANCAAMKAAVSAMSGTDEAQAAHRTSMEQKAACFFDVAVLVRASRSAGGAAQGEGAALLSLVWRGLRPTGGGGAASALEAARSGREAARAALLALAGESALTPWDSACSSGTKWLESCLKLAAGGEAEYGAEWLTRIAWVAGAICVCVCV
jgi:hypothetical protein